MKTLMMPMQSIFSWYNVFRIEIESYINLYVMFVNWKNLALIWIREYIEIHIQMRKKIPDTFKMMQTSICKTVTVLFWPIFSFLPVLFLREEKNTENKRNSYSMLFIFLKRQFHENDW